MVQLWYGNHGRGVPPCSYPLRQPVYNTRLLGVDSAFIAALPRHSTTVGSQETAAVLQSTSAPDTNRATFDVLAP